MAESYLIKPKVDENNNVGASNENCQLRKPSVEKVEAKKSRPSLRLMLTTAVVIVASGLFHLHSDKRPYDELRDFPYPRIPLFPRSGHEKQIFPRLSSLFQSMTPLGVASDCCEFERN